MPIQTTHVSKNEGIFFYIFLLTGFFLLLEISFFIQCNRPYLSDFTFVTDKLHIPVSILPGIFYFLFAQAAVHLAYCFLVWYVTLLVADLWQLSAAKRIQLAMGITLLGLVTALVANQFFFPNSKFAELTYLVMPNQTVAKFMLVALSFCCLIILLQALLTLLKKPAFLLLMTSSVCLAVLLSYLPQPAIHYDAATAEKPNIIFIGVDSLRPDFLSYFGNEKATPFFDSFLSQATVFSESVTPLARTFPSWTSILTGAYPKQTGIRTNLGQQNKVNLTETLPAILQRHGYETLYATDETRFSNIDKNYGFDRVITPPMGLNDFLIGTFNDFPLSNLLVNTLAGKWLFPHSYANRPTYFNYNPDSFLNLVEPALAAPRTQPVFLTVHFCLTHYPYLWSSLPGNDFSILERYQASVSRVDKQISDFFVLLKRYHLLDHAIVVLLSDHGEALELPGDRITENNLFLSMTQAAPIPKFYPPSLDDEGLDQSAGHGTDVLGLPQYHTLLAFKRYGEGLQKGRVVTGVVSLLDIKPTILDLLAISAAPSAGLSLAPQIKGEAGPLAPSHIFLESDFTPEAIRTVYPETRKVMLEGIQLFQIDPVTTRLTVKASMDSMIITSKQYADIYGEWMLALYPQNKDFRMPILINLVSGEWTNDLQSPFAKHSPAILMLQALKAFYGDEINRV